jgi:hypothetical protein
MWKSSLHRTGAASRKMKKKIATTKITALTPLTLIRVSMTRSPRSDSRDRLGRRSKAAPAGVGGPVVTARPRR